MFLGFRDDAWIVVTGRLRSPSRALTPLHPKQAHGDTGGIPTSQLFLTQPRMVRVSFRNRSTDIEKAAHPFCDFATTEIKRDDQAANNAT